MELQLDTSVAYLKGVGPRRAECFAKLHVETVEDLLFHFPRQYLDLTHPVPIAEAVPMEPCAIQARVVQKSSEQRIRSGLSIFKMQVADASDLLHITIFNARYTVESMKLEEEYIFFGKLTGDGPHYEMTSPVIYDVPKGNGVLPIYPQTSGIHSKLIRQCVAQAIPAIETIAEILPQEVLLHYALPNRAEALRTIHQPASIEQAACARNRFVFEELLILTCAMSFIQTQHAAQSVAPMQPVVMNDFYAALPFVPTDAQLRSIEQALSDMRQPVMMNRLMQGDVGSGKTLVAAACVYFAYQNGAQSAVMAPTEILAEQHFATFQTFLHPFGIKVALLTGATKAAERREILQSLAEGRIHLAVGTHALLSEQVFFQDLRLVVTDEQHRFGVAQRAALSQKNKHTHVLVMSATPIPRTLSLMIYGDLKLSIIDELPPGRQPVETLLIGSNKRARAIEFIRKALDEGQQAYIVCPLVAQGEEKTDLQSAVEYQQHLAHTVWKGYRVGLLHGKMKPADKEDTMRRFQSGEIQCLVSTTVIEVGVDVPNATIMLIENAERFGLSQLHQLRGRVGRGKQKSWCILVTDARNESTRERLRVMKQTNDGFQIAEYDLKLRGPGDFFGHRQHGLPSLKVASLSEDVSILADVQTCAAQLLAEDPALSQPGNQALRDAVDHMLQFIGERPN